MKQLSDVSIFNIKCGKDRVLNVLTNQVGTLDVQETGAEWLGTFVKWDGSQEYVYLNQYDKNLFLILS